MISHKKTDVIVVGAGASGLTAAICAGREGASVRILEHMDTAGKKLLLTGNGKCNLSNEDMNPAYFRGSHPAFAEAALSAFGEKETRDFFRSIGVLFRSRRGYLYPFNGEAVGVRNALLLECDKIGVEIYYEIGIKKITKVGEYFLFDTKQGLFEAHSCILATGGCSQKRTGSDGSGLLYLEPFSQPVKDVVPSLLQMKAKEAFFSEIAGIRAEACISLLVDGKEKAIETGELQLTDYGISGIPVFQLSRYASEALKTGKEVRALIDFLPGFSEEKELFGFYRALFHKNPGKLKDLLSGSLPHKLCPVLLREAGVENLPGKDVSEGEIRRLLRVIKEFPVTITEMYKAENAQVTAGGIDTEHVNPSTMESTLVPGLFFCGEVLDVDGPCGGYNLQWAWSSGLAAGTAAAKRRI